MNGDRKKYIKTFDGTKIKVSQRIEKKYRNARKLARQNKYYLHVLSNGRVCLCNDPADKYVIGTSQHGKMTLVHIDTENAEHARSINSALRVLAKKNRERKERNAQKQDKGVSHADSREQARA